MRADKLGGKNVFFISELNVGKNSYKSKILKLNIQLVAFTKSASLNKSYYKAL